MGTSSSTGAVPSRRLHSSGEAELAGIVKGAGEALGLKSLAEDLGLGATISIHADSSAAIGICQRTGVGKVRHLDVSQLWIQEKVKLRELELHKCLGTLNPADILTKHVPRATLEEHLHRLNVYSIQGRASVAPELI